MSGHYLKRYPDPRARQRAVANYSWLAGLEVLTRSAGAVANALDKLTALGTAQMVTDKPRSRRLAAVWACPRRIQGAGRDSDSGPLLAGVTDS